MAGNFSAMTIHHFAHELQLPRMMSMMQSVADDSQSGLPDVVAITLFASLICMCIVVGHLFEENRWVNESVTAILFGLISGVVVLVVSGGSSSKILRFDEELFFIYLLPPIIFNAGFQVKKKQFFRNFAAITAYGIIGVFISFAIISAGCKALFKLFGLPLLQLKDYMALGAIFSATDSVCTLQVLSQEEYPLLYSLVFGEGVVNDASSVVLFRAVQNFSGESFALKNVPEILVSFTYLFIASTALGILVGLASAFIIRTLYLGRHSTDREIALMVLMAYLSYVLSDLLKLSGILTVFFCGVVMSHYTWHNVTESSRVTTKHAFATMSFIAETFIFIYVGMDALDTEKWSKSYPTEGLSMVGMLLLLTMLGRAAFVFPLSVLINTRRRSDRTISFRHQIIIWWAGLMRGAVSIALTFSAFTRGGEAREAQTATIISATITVVLLSTAVFGILTRPLIDWLLPHRHLTRTESDLSEPGSPRNIFLARPLSQPLLSGFEGVVEDGEEGQVPVPLSPLTIITDSAQTFQELLRARERDVHAMWRWFDDKYMRPLFGGRGFVPYSPGSPTVMDVPSHVEFDAVSLPRRSRSARSSRNYKENGLGVPGISPFSSGRVPMSEAEPAWPEADVQPRNQNHMLT